MAKEKEKEKEKEEVVRKDTSFQIDFKACLRSGVPLCAVQTSDPASVIQQVREITQEKTANAELGILSWDLSAGIQAYNDAGKKALEQLIQAASTPSPGQPKPPPIIPEKVVDPIASIKLLKLLPPKNIIFIFNAHRLLHAKNLIPEAVICQTIWNLRDDFKSTRRTLVLPVPNINLPPELVNDIIILDEPLPTVPELRSKLVELYDVTGLSKPDEVIISKGAEAVRGLSMFGAEQAYAMSLSKEKNGLDIERLYHRKRKIIEQKAGLSIWRGRDTYKQVVGIERAREFLTAIFNGNDRPTVVLYVDELEKQLSGVGGDRSGVSDEMHGQFLSWLVDENVPFMLMYGQPGCSKSYLAKTTGAEFECPCIILSITGSKGGIVGQSTGQFDDALKTVSAIGRPLLMATSNDVDKLSQELRSRANLGTYFADLPSAENRLRTWQMYINKYEILTMRATIPPDDNWTPREISDCCQLAWRTKWTLKEASKSITPIIVSSPEKVEERRRKASKRFLSMDHPGVYDYNDTLYDVNETKIKEIKNVGQA